MFSRDIVLILAATFFYLASPNLINPLIAGYVGTLGASAALEGLIGGIMYLGSLLLRPFVGNWADHVSKYKMTMAGLILMLTAIAVYYFAPNPTVVLIGRIINGAGYCICSISITTWISDLFPSDKIGTGMGFYGMVTAVAMAFGPSAAILLSQRMSMQKIFLLAAGFVVISMVLVQLMTDRGAAPALVKQQKKKPFSLYLPSVLPVALMIMLFTIPFFASESFLVTYVQDRQFSVNISLFFPVYAGVLLMLRMVLKDYFDKVPFKYFLFASSLCTAVSLIALTNLYTMPIMILAACAMAGGYGIMSSECQSTAIIIAGPEKKGLGNATYYMGIDAGLILGPVIGGQILQHFPASYFYPILLITVPVILLIFFKNRKYLACVH